MVRRKHIKVLFVSDKIKSPIANTGVNQTKKRIMFK